MSSYISVAQYIAQDMSVADALIVLLSCAMSVALLFLFKPLLRGLALAAMLVVKPKLSKDERLQRRQMRDAMLLKRLMNSSERSPSDAAELRALASRA
ncbi:hypothetical protein [Massilia endophytica]|uniref:hypothetical protein n=1 Tax=Massilia endophytica TaxID=2899220 RepID=UPI001E4DD02C|nr:hypothetical protein [Massilia endophytica]UGQ46371.1 hypothetical protein LSQ66_21825 [Massilia endophytica]